LAANPQIPSQFDECGAPISTSRGMSGNAPSMRQPPSRSTVRPTQRANRLCPARGAFGGSGSTTSSRAMSSVGWPMWSVVPSVPVAAAASLLDRTAPALGVQPALLRGPGRLRRDPLLRRMQPGLDEGCQALAGVLAVALLGAETLRREHQHALV